MYYINTTVKPKKLIQDCIYMILIDKGIDINYILELEVSVSLWKTFWEHFNSLSIQRNEANKHISTLDTEHELKQKQTKRLKTFQVHLYFIKPSFMSHIKLYYKMV